MKLEAIIEQLCSHTISKHEAINKLNQIIIGLRTKAAVECIVEEKSTTSQDVYLKVKATQNFHLLQVREGDKVDVTVLP